jgi:uncharacterized protein YjbI with pentapeptide repeats
MAIPWIRWIAIAIAVGVAALALPWAIWWLWGRLSPQWDRRTVIAIAIVALALLWAIWWLWWRLPQRQVAQLTIQIPDPEARANVEDNFRKAVGQALGGAAVLLGVGAAYLQFTQQQQASRDLLTSNQVAKGFEQLAGEKAAMRLGGIYALEGVMNTSEQYHQPVLEALCAFVRDDTIGMIVNDRPVTDVQAALTVIGRRTEGGQVDLHNSRIRNASLNRADLSRADLRGADLRGVLLRGADLHRANLSHADLSRADLRGADLSLADLRGATLIGAQLTERDYSIVGIPPRSADLTNANLTGADLTDAEVRSNQLEGACGANVKNAGSPPLTLKGCFFQPDDLEAR